MNCIFEVVAMDTTKQKLIDFIRHVYPMSLENATEIATSFNERIFNRNEFILKQGKICNEYYFLEQGFARAWTHDPDGNDVTTSFYSPGEVVCELFSFFKRVPAGENMQALDDCKTWFLTFDQLQIVFHSLQQFREFGRTILVNSYATLKERTLSMISKTAEERYDHLLQTNPDVFQFAALKHIASYLGVTDTSLSRIRREYARK